jgi:hypothetical protein
LGAVVEPARVDIRAAPRLGRPGSVDEPERKPVDERIQRARDGSEPLKSLVLFLIPVQLAHLAHLRWQGSDQDQAGAGVGRCGQNLADRPGNPAWARYPFAEVAGSVEDSFVWDEPVEHGVPIADEVVTGPRLAAVTDPIEAVPDLAFVEDPRLLRIRQPPDEHVGRIDDLVDERGVRPVAQLRIQRVIPRAVTDGALIGLWKSRTLRPHSCGSSKASPSCSACFPDRVSSELDLANIADILLRVAPPLADVRSVGDLN